MTVEFVSRVVEGTLNDFVDGIVAAAPRILTGIVFLILAYAGIRIVLRIVRSTLLEIYPKRQRLIANLLVTIVGVFLWFGTVLTLFKILGMGDLAASLGTAVGFIALGISYALSNMIADTVAGVYLLRDPDFNPGDRVTTADVTGTVRSIELRKSRIELDDGDVTVLANREVEKEWTRLISNDTTAAD